MAVNVICGEGDCHVQANSPQVAVPLSHASPEPCDATYRHLCSYRRVLYTLEQPLKIVANEPTKETKNI